MTTISNLPANFGFSDQEIFSYLDSQFKKGGSISEGDYLRKITAIRVAFNRYLMGQDYTRNLHHNPCAVLRLNIADNLVRLADLYYRQKQPNVARNCTRVAQRIYTDLNNDRRLPEKNLRQDCLRICISMSPSAK